MIRSPNVTSFSYVDSYKPLGYMKVGTSSMTLSFSQETVLHEVSAVSFTTKQKNV